MNDGYEEFVRENPPEISQYEKQAQYFLNRYQLEFSWKKPAKQKSPPWGNTDRGPRWHYRIRIQRRADPRQHIAFDFFGSIADYEKGEDITAYDVLACISSDAQFQSAQDVIDELGWEMAVRPEAIAAFGRRLSKFFTPDELEALQEIH